MVTTANGAKTNATTGNMVYDFFSVIGASRNMSEGDIIKAFRFALKSNEDLAIRALLWARDIRGGAGERRAFRTIFAWLCENESEIANRVAPLVPTMGRFDDLFVGMGTKSENAVFNVWLHAIKSGNGLAAKWTPRRGPLNTALVQKCQMTPRLFRKMIVGMSNTVEQKMCAQQWSEINYAHVPSVASARYQKAFGKNDPTGYGAYIESLSKGKTKINASAIFPHDCIRGANPKVVDAQWAALPNFIPEGMNILPIIDTSGSMFSSVGSNRNLRCIDIAVSLGIYCSERLDGAWKNKWMTFSDSPVIEDLPRFGGAYDKFHSLSHHHGWGMSTNYQRAMQLVKRIHDLNQGANPIDFLLVVSDMEFNSCGGHTTNFEKIKADFPDMPKIVFWNVNARLGNQPVTILDENTISISGFSPSILKSILGGDMHNYDPVKVMTELLMDSRYNW